MDIFLTATIDPKRKLWPNFARVIEPNCTEIPSSGWQHPLSCPSCDDNATPRLTCICILTEERGISLQYLVGDIISLFSLTLVLDMALPLQAF